MSFHENHERESEWPNCERVWQAGMPACNRAPCTGEISSEGTAEHTLGWERWCEDWICFVQYLCISIMVQWNLSASTKYWVTLTFCITFFPLLPPFLPSFSGVNMCKQGVPWKFYLFKVLSPSTAFRRLWARIYWNWDLTCTVISHPVACCESEDSSSRCPIILIRPDQLTVAAWGMTLRWIPRQSLGSMGKRHNVCESRGSVRPTLGHSPALGSPIVHMSVLGYAEIHSKSNV